MQLGSPDREPDTFVAGEAGEAYQRLFAALPVPALVLDHMGFIRLANLQASDYLGLSHTARLQRRSILQMLEAGDRQRLLWRLGDRTGQDAFEMREVKLLLPGVQAVPCDLQLVHLGAGLTTEPMSLVVLVDRSLEAELRLSQERLREQGHRLADAIWASQSGFWEWHVPSKALKLDDRFAQILGCAPDEVMHLDADGLSNLIHPEDQGRIRELMRNLRAGREPTFNMRVRMAHQASGWVWITNRGRVLEWGDDDRPLRLGGAIHDISSEVEREDALRAAKEQAEASERTKSEWLANVGHEVRTPLNSVVGIVQLMRERATDEVQREQLRQVAQSAEALRQTLDDLLDNAKLEAGKVIIETLPIDMAEFTRSIMAVFGHQARALGLELTIELAAHVPQVVEGDPLRLRQVVTNLVSNALKFTAHGRVTVRLGGRPDAMNRRFNLQVEVSDTGIGIAPQALQQLFTPFYQADASTNRRYGGSGLGLSISRRIVKLMGGQIGVESTLGLGSRFWFQVPLTSSMDDFPDRKGLRLTTAAELQQSLPNISETLSNVMQPNRSAAPPNTLFAQLERSLLLQEHRALALCESLMAGADPHTSAILRKIHDLARNVDFDAAAQELAAWRAQHL